MKVFVGGAKTLGKLDDNIKEKLLSFCREGYEILIGDCHGADGAMQKFLADTGYRKVKVYVSGEKVRNNVGGWEVCNVPVQDGITGYQFYRQKDLAMVNDADFGYMICDGKSSRGTLGNILALSRLDKPVSVYVKVGKETVEFNGREDVLDLTIKEEE